MDVQAKNCQQPPEARKQAQNLFSELQKNNLTSGIWLPRNEKISFVV